MKPVESLVRDNIKNLEPCVHGGEVLDAAGKSGFKREEILDFSSSVNPLGPSKKALDEGADAYLVKPVKPQELLMLLEEKLKNREEPADVSN